MDRYILPLFQTLRRKRNHCLYRVGTFLTVFSFMTQVMAVTPRVYAEVFSLPAPGEMIYPTPAFIPASMKGIKIFPDNPLRFDFIIDTGNTKLSQEDLKLESTKLIKYFLASLTIPEEDLWVNLSPYEKDRIIPDQFGITEMGRDLLAEDYILKQLTASLMYPEKELGKEFWQRVYKNAQALYGTTEIPINTFNKVWVVPDKAVVFENGDTAFIVESHLKVMLEVDYVAMSHQKDIVEPRDPARGLALKENLNKEDFGMDQLKMEDAENLNDISSEIVREVILPEIEKEVNEGENFTKLRQIYRSMILATWFKRNLRESFLGKIYVGKNKISGVDIEDENVREKIYAQYLEAFKTGVYNYIKEDYDPATQEIIPRKYFSGGMEFGDRVDATTEIIPQPKATILVSATTRIDEASYTASVVLDPVGDMGASIGDWFKRKKKPGDQTQSVDSTVFQTEDIVSPIMDAETVADEVKAAEQAIPLESSTQNPGEISSSPKGLSDSAMLSDDEEIKLSGGMWISNYPGRYDPLLVWFDENSLFNVQDISSSSAIVDVGTSFGYGALDLARKLEKKNPSLRVYGIDPGDHVGRVTKTEKMPANLIFIQDDHRLQSTSRPKEPIKMMTVFNLLQYADSRQKPLMIQQIAKNLTEDGLLILGEGIDTSMVFFVFQKKQGQLVPMEMVFSKDKNYFDQYVDYFLDPFKDFFRDEFRAWAEEFDRILRTGSISRAQGVSDDFFEKQLAFFQRRGVQYRTLSNGFVSISLKPFTDQAALGSPESSTQNPGGISLNPNMLDLQTQGQGIDFNIPFDPQIFQSIPIEGFNPLIIQIIPTNLPVFLNLSKDGSSPNSS